MNIKPENLAVTLTITAILLSYIPTNMKSAFSDNTGGEIDLYTKKEPYSGKGPNTPSDAFGPGEVVVLYALVTYSKTPLQNLLVIFSMQSPDNASFSLTARTNASGVATVNFTIPQKCFNESEIFGKWFVLASLLIGGNVFQDTLTFRVNWIVKLISVKTVDENLTYRTDFGIEGDVGLEITLRSIAMSIKNATLAIVLLDELNVPVNYSEIRDFEVQPNEKLIFLYCKLYLPKWAHVGKATVYVSALTASTNESGVPYCPAVSTELYIMPYGPLKIALHDAAIVKAVPSATKVEIGQLVNINAVVRNEGTEIESFNVSAYYADVLIETLHVTALTPYSQVALSFTFDTSLVNAGNYTITVSIPHLVNEADKTDNFFVNGIIEVKLPTIIHDIAIIDVNISKNSVYIGELLKINVSVANKGTETETFNVSTYYNFTLIGTLQVIDLALGTRTSRVFVWNTSCVQEGLYRISASAPLSGDVNVSDNEFIDGIVQVKAKPPPPLHDVAVLNVTPSSNSLYIGETLAINVTVKNEGNHVESFNVTVRYDSDVIGTLFVDSLAAGVKDALLFHWDTSGVPEGSYTLSAFAEPVAGEEDTEDNSLEDGVVEVRVAPAAWFIPEWLWWIILPLLILVIVLLIILLYRRKKRKEAREAFYSGWTAWYYGYDLRNKIHKT